MNCTHTREHPPIWNEEECPYTGQTYGHWHYPEPERTYEDIDTGRYRCTQCGEVFYYTGLWRAHWEGGRKLLDERTGCHKGKDT